MVGTGRFELPTFRLGGGRSIQLSYVPTSLFSVAFKTLLANISAELHSIKLNLVHCFIGIVESGPKIVSCSCYSKNSAACSLQSHPL